MPHTDTPRSYGLHCYWPPGKPARIEFDRETLRDYGDGLTHRVGALGVVREGPSIASRPLPGGSATVRTYGELFVLLEACGHDLGADEVDVRAKAKVREAEEFAKEQVALAALEALRAQEARERAAKNPKP